MTTKTERRIFHKVGAAKKTAKRERAELKALGWDKDRISLYMEKWIAATKVREVQNELINFYLMSPRYCRIFGRDLKYKPIREGLPTISDMEMYIYPELTTTFEAILREERNDVADCAWDPAFKARLKRGL